MMKMNKQRLINIIYLCLPVLVSVVVFLLPAGLQEHLILKLDHLNVWSWLTHIFVHQNMQHLIGNMVVYLAAGLLAIILFPEKDNKIFRIILLALVIITPLITFCIEGIMRNLGLFPSNLINSRGFSGVSSATVGVLGFSISRKIQDLFGEFGKKQGALLFWSYYILLPTFAIMTLQLSWKLSLAAGFIWLVLVATALIPAIREVRQMKTKPKLIIHLRDKISLISALVVLLSCAVVLTPKFILFSGTVVDILAHFIGFVAGFIISFLIVWFNESV